VAKEGIDIDDAALQDCPLEEFDLNNQRDQDH
jgi:hypothetical protein